MEFWREMNKNIIRAIACAPAGPMVLNTVMFVINPSKATGDLGMELLDGIGRSTQLGDFGAFFGLASFLIVFGSIKMKYEYLNIAALLLGSAAFFRIIAWALNDAALATSLIIAELALVLWLVISAKYIKKLAS